VEPDQGLTRRRKLAAVIAGAAGLALFGYAVRSVGVAEIASGVRRIGWGLAVILALAGVRFLIRAECWRRCMAPDMRLGIGRAWRAFLAGDAVGSITPLGLLASEPTKVFLTRRHLATGESVASLALENVIYAASVLAMVAFGILVLLAVAPLDARWRWIAVATLAGGAAGLAVARRLLRGPWDEERGDRPRWRARLSSIRQTALASSVGRRTGLWQVFGLDLLFHALAVVEVFLTLRWLMPEQGPTAAQAVVFEALNRVVTVVFKFVPFRVGVDEALTGALAPLLAVTPAAGVTLAIVRKVRNLFWAGVGLALTAARLGESSARAPEGPARDRHGSASVRRS
jgi:hypothetical protein